MGLLQTLRRDDPRWIVVRETQHPDKGTQGVLVRHVRTGIYRLDTLVSLMSVPQAWARAQERTHTESSDGTRRR